MFGDIVTLINIEGYNNLGVYFERDGKLYNELTLTEIGVADDNIGSYFYVLKNNEFNEVESLGCSMTRVKQLYTFVFIDNCSNMHYIMQSLMRMNIDSLDLISNPIFIIKGLYDDVVTDGLVKTVVSIEFIGDINDCSVTKRCCC